MTSANTTQCRPLCISLTGDGLHDFFVGVGTVFDPSEPGLEPLDFTECVNVTGTLAPGESRLLNCRTPRVGRYVVAYIPENSDRVGRPNDVLTICELMVYGKKGEEGE